MAIIKMKRLRLLALRSDREELLHTLQRLGCVEISEPPEADGRSDAPPGDWEGPPAAPCAAVSAAGSPYRNPRTVNPARGVSFTTAVAFWNRPPALAERMLSPNSARISTAAVRICVSSPPCMPNRSWR